MYAFAHKLETAALVVAFLVLLGGVFLAQPAHAATEEERLETISTQINLIRNVVAAFNMMQPAEYSLVVSATSTNVEKYIQSKRVEVLNADIKQSATVLTELAKQREEIQTQMTELRTLIAANKALIKELRKEDEGRTEATSTRKMAGAATKAKIEKLVEEIKLAHKKIAALQKQRGRGHGEMTELLTKVKQKQGLIIKEKKEDEIETKTERAIKASNAKPVCTIKADKNSYVLGETITFSWESQNATKAEWKRDSSGKDNLVMPSTAATSGSYSIEANVLGNPYVTLMVSKNTARNSCTKRVEVNESDS